LEQVNYAMRLSPKDRYLGLWSNYIGRIHFELGQDEDAERWLLEATRLTPRRPQYQAALAAFYAETGRLDAALRHTAETRKLDPALTREALALFFSGLAKSDEHKPQRLLSGLSRAFGETPAAQ
jgi:tetratricopeptide (TPR) repeat protein